MRQTLSPAQLNGTAPLWWLALDRTHRREGWSPRPRPRPFTQFCFLNKPVPCLASEVRCVYRIEARFADGDVSIYLKDGAFLACEEGREEAIRAANFVLTGYRNGATWAPKEIESGRGHLQKYFPEIAEKYGAKLRT